MTPTQGTASPAFFSSLASLLASPHHQANPCAAFSLAFTLHLVLSPPHLCMLFSFIFLSHLYFILQLLVYDTSCTWKTGPAFLCFYIPISPHSLSVYNYYCILSTDTSSHEAKDNGFFKALSKDPTIPQSSVNA